MVAAEFLSHYEPEVWAKEVAPRFKESVRCVRRALDPEHSGPGNGCG